MDMRIRRLLSPKPFWFLLPLLLLCETALAATSASKSGDSNVGCGFLQPLLHSVLTCSISGNSLSCNELNTGGCSDVYDPSAVTSAANTLIHVWFPYASLSYPDKVCAIDGVATLCWNINFTGSGTSLRMSLSSTANTGNTDTDNDGVLNPVDNCINVSNASQLDTDGDSLGNVCDPDDDNDGAIDSVDVFPTDGCASVDTDGDGMPDTMSCINEGFESGSFSSVWVNQNWAIVTSPVHSGTKSAWGGVSSQLTTTTTINAPQTLSFYYTRSTVSADLGFSIDGVSQSLGVTSGWLSFSALLQPGQHTLRWYRSCFSTFNCATTGTYGIDDITLGTTTLVLDLDDDNDGVKDTIDKFPLDPTETLDTDNDGIGNNADWDDDNDGVPDTVDAAPLNASNTSEITLPLNTIYKGGKLSGVLE